MSASRWAGAVNDATCHPDAVRMPRSHSASLSDGTSLTDADQQATDG